MATSAGKAMFWVHQLLLFYPPWSFWLIDLPCTQDFVGAPANQGPKVVAFEGEFAFLEGHAQELKTIALAQQVGKRLRLFFSYNNAGIDDALIGGSLFLMTIAMIVSQESMGDLTSSLLRCAC